ncbi:IS1182 family transposase [Chryseobacterium polytrichastri]|uniref:Transposase, IS4 family n=1 Tax=Chryseobacterium polytrichastri TaxID=1302687 RepID=A0A1M7IS79_9FLAO|nr:IS1182 family transposase [Chryseobacterium polytrichastri]SHM43646.1 transposase, IS4 family [Chryseobacterium polytrichastri]
MAVRKPIFRPYHQDQLMALPPNLDDLIPADHTVRVVNDVINAINVEPLLKAYHVRGGSNYHPLLLLKVLVYGYVTNIYSSRKLAEACRERVPFMWLSAMNKPDHNTINRFRGVRLKHTLRSVFEEVVKLLVKEDLLSIDQVYTDGTKIEANANKYTFVWKKSIQTNKEKMKKQLEEIWNYAQSVAADEDMAPEPPTATTIDKESIKATVEKLNKVLADNDQVDKKVKAKLRYINQTFPVNIAKYEQQEVILGERNSYSKTDTDATFMRMKEDHMLNGQLKPAYNIQISTANQFIVNYTIHPNPTDTTTLKAHLEQYESSFGKVPQTLTADAGYGSEENYMLLEEKQMEAYVKYNLFDKGQNDTYNKKYPFAADKLFYNDQLDVYICPMGQQMHCIGDTTKKTTTGFKQIYRAYQAKNCSNCPLNGICHKSKTNRIIEVNLNLKRLKQKAHELLNTDEGIRHRKKRCFDVEPVFANIKQNHGFRRFMLRGKEKVEIEWGLLAIAQNLRKKAA